MLAEIEKLKAYNIQMSLLPPNYSAIVMYQPNDERSTLIVLRILPQYLIR